jgi:hypothetical protein
MKEYGSGIIGLMKGRMPCTYIGKES